MNNNRVLCLYANELWIYEKQTFFENKSELQTLSNGSMF